MGLDVVELVMDVEAQFGLEVPDADASRLRTVGDLYRYVRAHAPALPARPDAAPGAVPTGDPVWERLLDILERETGHRRERLTPDASFVDDLGMD